MDTSKRYRIDEEKAYQRLLTSIPKKRYSYLCTKGRGGLSILQRLAYDLDIKNIFLLKNNYAYASALLKHTLFVDDIECTSETILSLSLQLDTAVLVQRQSSEQIATYVGHLHRGDEYIQFSWEGKDNG